MKFSKDQEIVWAQQKVDAAQKDWDAIKDKVDIGLEQPAYTYLCAMIKELEEAKAI